MFQTRFLMLCFAAALFACDDDGGDSGGQEIDDPAVTMGGKQTGEKSADLTTLTDDVDANGAQGPITSIGGAADLGRQLPIPRGARSGRERLVRRA